MPPDARPDFVVMAGDGELMGEMRRRVDADPWLRERCRLLGVLEDMPGFLAASTSWCSRPTPRACPTPSSRRWRWRPGGGDARLRRALSARASTASWWSRATSGAWATRSRRMTHLDRAERAAMGRALRARALEEFGMEERGRAPSGRPTTTCSQGADDAPRPFATAASRRRAVPAHAGRRRCRAGDVGPGGRVRGRWGARWTWWSPAARRLPGRDRCRRASGGGPAARARGDRPGAARPATCGANARARC